MALGLGRAAFTCTGRRGSGRPPSGSRPLKPPRGAGIGWSPRGRRRPRRASRSPGRAVNPAGPQLLHRGAGRGCGGRPGRGDHRVLRDRSTRAASALGRRSQRGSGTPRGWGTLGAPAPAAEWRPRPADPGSARVGAAAPAAGRRVRLTLFPGPGVHCGTAGPGEHGTRDVRYFFLSPGLAGPFCFLPLLFEPGPLSPMSHLL